MNKIPVKINLEILTKLSYPDLLQFCKINKKYKTICNNNQLTFLPSKCPKLSTLNCGYNQLTFLPEYPELFELHCIGNHLKKLPNYPKLYVCQADDNLCPSGLASTRTPLSE